MYTCKNAYGIFTDKICQLYHIVLFASCFSSSIRSYITVMLDLTPPPLIVYKKMNKFQLIQKAAR